MKVLFILCFATFADFLPRHSDVTSDVFPQAMGTANQIQHTLKKLTDFSGNKHCLTHVR